MKQIKLALYGLKSIIVIFVVFGLNASIYARNDDCWVDLYDDTQFKGRHVRLKGPIKLTNLLKLDVQVFDIEKVKSGILRLL
ncbi:hypothetical protein BMR03_03280 [Methylococcaceae bacterium HT2]|nr:hypothetical protein BMR03_03280 [Methylococcaceae bacterium HT2]